MSEELLLSGGALTVGVVRVGATVRRPSSSATSVVCDVLLHLERAGFGSAPRWLGIDEQGREILSWIEGDTFTERGRMHPYIGDPPDRVTFSDEQIAASMRLLRHYHDAFDDAHPGDAADDVAYALRTFVSYGFAPFERGDFVRRTDGALAAYGENFDVPAI
ncbi:MAG: hypothetical protein H0X39_18115, partial [Actinobacteria bacterium]|nr:hypothetical protein [Actinomycetota bacterium]